MSDADVIVVGLGLVGAVVAAELTRAGHSVLALESGPDRDPSRGDFEEAADEIAARRGAFAHDVRLGTWTLRHSEAEPSTPMRRLGAFTPGQGVGGSALLYGGLPSRYTPWDFSARSRLVDEFGPGVLPAGSLLADWCIDYDEIEPYYRRFEAAIGNSARDDASRAKRTTPAFDALETAVADAGYELRPTVTTTLNRPYANPYGVTRHACRSCGFCLGYPCRFDAKGEATTTLLPAARATGRLRIVPSAEVFQVEHDERRATRVRYRDAEGAVHSATSKAVVLAAYAFGNTRLLLLSRMGEPYDPRTGGGAVGKGYSTNINVHRKGLYAGRKFANQRGPLGSGFTIDSFTGDRLSPFQHGFVGGAEIVVGNKRGGAIAGLVAPLGTPRWGAGWKKAIREWYDSDVAFAIAGQVLPYRDAYLDLDPNYTDRFGTPLLRITFDWHDNERRLARFMLDRVKEVIELTGATHSIGLDELEPHFDTVRYQGTHHTGGATMGDDPASSVVDSFQRLHGFDNVWAVGGSAIPQGGASGPTGTIGALAYRAADDIRSRLS